MRLKDRIAQAFSGSGKKSGGSARRGVAAAEENATPLVPKRLLTPGGALPGSTRPRADTGLRDLTASGTVSGAVEAVACWLLGNACPASSPCPAQVLKQELHSMAAAPRTQL